MSLHSRIMNLRFRESDEINAQFISDSRVAYKSGHRDARHAAAELALKADALADAVQDVLVWRDTAPRMGYLRDNDASRDALARLAKVLAEFDA